MDAVDQSGPLIEVLRSAPRHEKIEEDELKECALAIEQKCQEFDIGGRITRAVYDTKLRGRYALTDRSDRFLASELIREKLFRLTGDELPYSSTVVIDKFEEEGNLRRIAATIVVEPADEGRDVGRARLRGPGPTA